MTVSIRAGRALVAFVALMFSIGPVVSAGDEAKVIYVGNKYKGFNGAKPADDFSEPPMTWRSGAPSNKVEAAKS